MAGARSISFVFVIGCLATIGPNLQPAFAATEEVIHTFGDFTSGANPYAPVTRDAEGNLYGTTDQGGQANLGVVYKIDASGNQTVLHGFTGGVDGANPYAGVIRSANGNIFGTTYAGGKSNLGVVFRIDPLGNFTVLHSFAGGSDGAYPYAPVMADSAGNLYGTTFGGGSVGAGVVYKLDGAGQETILHSFTGKADGGYPRAGLVTDAVGNLYGTTYRGGSVLNDGVVYKMTPAGVETVLYTFHGSDGNTPGAELIFDTAGNLYGTANDVVFELTAAGVYKILQRIGCLNGGSTSAGVVLDTAGNIYGTTYGCNGGALHGGVYKLTPTGSFRLLYAFPGPSRFGNEYSTGPNSGLLIDKQGNLCGTTPYGAPYYVFPGAPGGASPYAGVTRDAAGNLYGVTQAGGAANAGVVYKVTAAGKEEALYSFTGGADGQYPESNVVLDSAGNIYGTAVVGGAFGQGVVFRLDAAGNFTLLFIFTGGADGGHPTGVTLDAAGNLYGTTFSGGAASQTGVQEGVVFKLDLTGHETLLHSFTGFADGGNPNSGVIRDADGNLYGTTISGGLGAGVVFRIGPDGTETVLHSFTGVGSGGGLPYGGVIRDSAGNLYGTAADYGADGGGVVFMIDPDNNYTVLYSFTAVGPGGSTPFSGVVRDSAGNLYGTAPDGGRAGCAVGCGVVYMLDPSGQETVLYSFTGGTDGSYPYAGLTMDAGGHLYGTTLVGGRAGTGVVYKLPAPFAGPIHP